MTHVGFLWHMHQPLYIDPETDQAVLPWVRLHATRAYYDMVQLALEYPDVPQTFNLVPVLLLQLEHLQRGAKDKYRLLSEKPADELTEEECRFIIELFFQASWQTLVYPNPGYRRLLELRGGENMALDAVERYTLQDRRDLQVWFNLAWFGFMARRHFPLIDRLLKKQQDFTEEEKLALLHIQDLIVARIIPLYREAQQRGAIELTTTPFYHPILPLLCTTEAGRRALPHLHLPQPAFEHPEDALAQVERALSYVEALFGQRPQGMWPSEGSVSPEVMAVLTQAGVRWCATSEGILQNSRLQPGTSLHFLSEQGRPTVFEPYQTGDVSIFFRQLELSDRVGFSYSHMPGPDAAADLLNRIRGMVSGLRGQGTPLVPIILDGENPWEHYSDGGESFLRTLLEGLRLAPDLKAVTFSQHLELQPPVARIAELWSGSWIYSNFQIWIGHPEDVAGWSLLRDARTALEQQRRQGLPVPEEAWSSLYAAEGSDWFWWFGDEFSSSAESEFDRLFRVHVKNVYLKLGLNPPGNLELPIKGLRRFQPLKPPRGIIRPALDGRTSVWWEWEEAGSTPLHATGGAMARGNRLLSQLLYGYDEQSVFFRLDLGPDLRQNAAESLELEIMLVAPVSYQLRAHLTPAACVGRAAQRLEVLPTTSEQAPSLLGRPLVGKRKEAVPALSEAPAPSPVPNPVLEVRALLEAQNQPQPDKVRMACGEMLEFSLPRRMLQLERGGELLFFLNLTLPNGGRMRYPAREIFQWVVPPPQVLNHDVKLEP
ncbi:MAG: glycoside hydrolase [Myxococcota bacterium]